MAKLTAADLLVKMSADPALRARFQGNPGGVLDEFGIDGDDRAVLMSGNPERLRSYLGGSDAPPGCLVLFAADEKSDDDKS
jgi:hypothetical protein